MAFCCPDKKFYETEKLFKNLRSINNLGIKMKLKSDVLDSKDNKNFVCNLDQKEVKWNGNIDEVYNADDKINEKDDEEIRKKRQEIIDKEIELDNLEKEYLAKTVRLLYMVQTHCQIKQENEKLFEYYGIKTGNVKFSGIEKNTSLDNNKKEKKIEEAPL